MGFDASMFVEQPVDHEFLCQICSNVQEKPTTACCNGHTVCLACLETWEKQKPKCPAGCGAAILETKTLNRPIQCLIAKLQVQCPLGSNSESSPEPKRPRRVTRSASKRPTCNWKGTLGEFLDSHSVNKCPLAKVHCEFCDQELEATEMKKHHQVDCTRHPIPCKRCGETIERRLVLAHMKNSCPEATILCAHGCGATMLRKDFGAIVNLNTLVASGRYSGHLQTCPNLRILCPHYDNGCSETIMRKDLPAHLRNSAALHDTLASKAFEAKRDNWTMVAFKWRIQSVSFRRMRGLATNHGASEYCPKSATVTFEPFKIYLKLVRNVQEEVDILLFVSMEQRSIGEWPSDAIKIDQLKISIDPFSNNHEKNDSSLMQRGEGNAFLFRYVAPLLKADDSIVEGVPATRTRMKLDDLFDYCNRMHGQCIINVQCRLKASLPGRLNEGRL